MEYDSIPLNLYSSKPPPSLLGQNWRVNKRKGTMKYIYRTWKVLQNIIKIKALTFEGIIRKRKVEAPILATNLNKGTES